jgi:hypothetical protein
VSGRASALAAAVPGPLTERRQQVLADGAAQVVEGALLDRLANAVLGDQPGGAPPWYSRAADDPKSLEHPRHLRMMWEAVGEVSSVLSLLAFLAAVIVGYLRRRLRHREELIRSAADADRGRLAQTILDRVSVDTANLTRQQRYELVHEVLRRRSERLKWGLLTFAVLFLVSAGLGAYAFVSEQQLPVYSVRIMPIGPGGQPIAGTTIETSIPAVRKRVEDGWEIELPASALPADRRLDVWVRKEDDFLHGHAQLRLANDLRPGLRVELQKELARVAGLVVDEADRPVEGARVFVVGRPGAAYWTGGDGQFSLAAHAAEGETVHLRADKPGYRPAEEYPYGGERSVRITLRELQ